MEYKGMGFVESLIAIILVGVASVILMRVAANTLLEGVQNERIDKMTQYAIEGVYMTEVILQEMVDDNKNPVEELGLNHDNKYKCFVPIVDESSNFGFKKDAKDEEEVEQYKSWRLDDNLLKSMENRKKLGDRVNAGLVEITETSGEEGRIDYFRIVCFGSVLGNEKPPFLSTQVIVGHILSRGDITKGGNVKDYIHSTIITL